MSVRREHTVQYPLLPNKTTLKKPINITPKIASPQCKLLIKHKHELALSPKTNSRKEPADEKLPQSREDVILLKKQKDFISHLLRTKMERGKKRWRTQNIQQKLVLRKNTISGFENLEFQIMKPTDKLFYKLENMRLAQKILLARPSLELNRSHLSTFYKRQKNYQINMRKMPNRYHSKGKHSKQINRKQWID